MTSTPRPAIVLLSGGLDSATCLAIARAEMFAPIFTMSFDYGQRHRHELAAAEKLSKQFGARQHRVIRIDLRQFGGSALTSDIAVPKDRDESQMTADIPVTYVPARNTIFLSHALAWAEVLDARHLFIGVNVLDASGYPDCRPEFVEAFERLANLATRAGVEGARLTVHAPLIEWSKAEIIRRGTALGVDYGLTWTCYAPAPDGRACGLCDACQLRRKGFTEAGLTDPIPYAS